MLGIAVGAHTCCGSRLHKCTFAFGPSSGTECSGCAICWQDVRAITTALWLIRQVQQGPFVVCQYAFLLEIMSRYSQNEIICEQSTGAEEFERNRDKELGSCFIPHFDRVLTAPPKRGRIVCRSHSVEEGNEEAINILATHNVVASTSHDAS